MPRSGEITREKILDATQELVFEHGFVGTSIDKVIERAGLTKGALFYHFDSKASLGRGLIERYARQDIELLDQVMRRAEKLSRDPRQQILIFVGLYQESLETLPAPVSGCLFASYLYERSAYPEDVAEIARGAIGEMRGRFAAKLREAFKIVPHEVEADPDILADALVALIEGGFVLAKIDGDAGVFAGLFEHYRANLERLLGIELGLQDASRT